MWINVKAIDIVALQMIVFSGKYVKAMAIVAVETEIGGDPGKTPAILLDIIDKPVGETIVGAYRLYFPGTG
jgi:hypothetical protein